VNARIATFMGMEGMMECRGQEVEFSKFSNEIIAAQATCAAYSPNRAVNISYVD